MGSPFRSEKMTKCQLFLQPEAGYMCVAELGELGIVQFRDLNPEVTAFQRKYVNEVRRCDEMERKLRFIEKEIKKDGIRMHESRENPNAPQPREMIDLEASFEKLESELREVNANEEALRKNYLELTELKHVLRKTQAFYDERENTHHARQESVPAAREASTHVYADLDLNSEPHVEQQMTTQGEKLDLSFITGVIPREKLLAFERLLWRTCRGNVFIRLAEIEEPLQDPVTNFPVQKCVFIIYFQGEQLKSRVRKICDGYRASTYACPESAQERREKLLGVMTRTEDLRTVLNQSQEHRRRVLDAAAKNIRLWFTKVRKMKAIYHTLNMFNLDVTQKCLIAECWSAEADLEKIRLALQRGTGRSGSAVPSFMNPIESDETPPTYNRVNKFTAGFQNIVDAYGVANYGEMNPATFTIISFPFLFAVMFGDAGHGLIMFLFALFLVLMEKKIISLKIRDEIFSTFFGGRYIILLMGLFSIYTGFVYNDIFSKSVNIFGSNWRVPNNTDAFNLDCCDKLTLDPNSPAIQWTGSSPYPFGMDPVWNLAENKLNFINSFKMKMSVILGITQMLFGVFLSSLNYRYFREPLDIYCQFIPQLLFLTSIFVYLCALVVYKWIAFTPYSSQMAVGYYPGTHCAPSLLIGLINMVMFKIGRNEGFMKDNSTVNAYDDCYLSTFYPAQAYVEVVLVVIAVICVPWMLLAKPLILRSRHKRQAGAHVSARANMHTEEAEVTVSNGNAKQSASGGHGGHGHGDEFDFGEIFIHQTIHTIEFCLGCISHTASYLRLWALSLAHAQLSEVLWTMIMSIALGTKGSIGIVFNYLIFWAFGTLTVGVLIIMEGLSAFLHALRLHWVEFQSKFYGGNGYGFAPFSFETMLDQASAADEED